VKEKYYFENKLMKTLPKVIELNLIAKEFKRNISMAVKMMLFSQDSEIQTEKMNIKVQVDNRELGYRYLWDLNKFSNRYYIIKDLIEKYYETGIVP
jgi:kinesin family protein 13